MNDVAKGSGQALKGRYILRDKLGAGGQGEVWRASDLQTGNDIALKILQPPSGRSAAAWVSLIHEHEVSQRLDHPGILKVFAPERDGASFLLPMELAPGGDLRRLRGANYLTVIPVLLEIAKALEHAHERGIIHRDLKPGNVLFDAHGRVKLADFGVAGRASDTGSMRGLSPFTASPEQLRGEAPMPGDDIYGLGALAYELLSRNPPHYPHFDAERMQREPVPPLVPTQQIPPQLAALVSAMLEKDPRKRPANLRDVADELDAALNDTLTFDFETEEQPFVAPESANRTTPPIDQPALLPAFVPAAPVSVAGPPPPAPEQVPETPQRGAVDGAAIWEQVREAPIRQAPPFQPMRSGVPRALVLVSGVAALAAAAYLWLGHANLERGAAAAPAAAAADPDQQLQAKLAADHAQLAQRIVALQGRGADSWGGTAFANAKDRAALVPPSGDAAGAQQAERAIAEAGQLLDVVEEAAPTALNAELAAGERAVGAGQATQALEHYDLAVRIAPQDARALAGQARARALTAGAAAAAPAAAASAAPPGSPAFGTDAYAKAAGEGFAALGAGRLNEARAAFERARALRPDGSEALDGLKRVDAAEHSRSFGSLQVRAQDLEADERWDEAAALYASALRANPALEFAQAGKARAEGRAQLGNSLQAYIDRPDLLAAPSERNAASALLQQAHAVNSPGPVLRLQMARVSGLLPEFEKTVHLQLVSDGLTQVAIPEVGTFGGFAQRDVELKPGHYTVIGTREGYREVRRDITLSPGQQAQTINVTCYDPS